MDRAGIPYIDVIISISLKQKTPIDSGFFIN